MDPEYGWRGYQATAGWHCRGLVVLRGCRHASHDRPARGPYDPETGHAQAGDTGAGGTVARDDARHRDGHAHGRSGLGPDRFGTDRLTDRGPAHRGLAA